MGPLKFYILYRTFGLYVLSRVKLCLFWFCNGLSLADLRVWRTNPGSVFDYDPAEDNIQSRSLHMMSGKMRHFEASWRAMFKVGSTTCNQPAFTVDVLFFILLSRTQCVQTNILKTEKWKWSLWCHGCIFHFPDSASPAPQQGALPLHQRLERFGWWEVRGVPGRRPPHVPLQQRLHGLLHR